MSKIKQQKLSTLQIEEPELLPEQETEATEMTLIDLDDLQDNPKPRLTESETDEVAKLSIIDEEGDETDDYTPVKAQDSERSQIRSQAYTETSLMRIVIMLD